MENLGGTQSNSGVDKEAIDVLRIALESYKEGNFYGRGSGNLVLTDDYWRRVEDIIRRYDGGLSVGDS